MNIAQGYINHTLVRVAERFYADLYAKDQKNALDEAFAVFSISLVLDKPMEEVYENIIVHGSEDGGIDGVYLEYFDNRPILYVFQCKNTAKVSANVLEKFEDNFEQIFIKGNTQKAHSADLMQHLARIEYFDKTQNVFFDKKLHYIFNGDKTSASSKNPIERVGDKRITYRDANDIYELVGAHLGESHRRPLKFTFKPEKSNLHPTGGVQSLFSYAVFNVRSAVFRLSALELCALVHSEKLNNGSIGALFSTNIRGFLGRQNFTNSRIVKTLEHSKHKYYFPFLNNGITIVCDKIKVPDDMQNGQYFIETTNPVIINGLQTTNLIYEQYMADTHSLLNVYVTVRLYETEESDLVELITDATNTQSAIDFRDKISNKAFMKALKTFFATKKIALITKRGEAFQNFYYQNAFDTNMENDKALMLWYNFFVNEHASTENAMQEFYIAESEKEHPLYPFLHEKIENFISQVYFVTKNKIANIENTNLLEYKSLALADLQNLYIPTE